MKLIDAVALAMLHGSYGWEDMETGDFVIVTDHGISGQCRGRRL